KGCFLIASPHLPDPNFFRSVVLIVEHNEEGAMGVILNRASNTMLDEFWSEVSESACESDDPLYVGGPVEGPLMAVHDDSDLEGIEVMKSVFFTSDRDSLESLVCSHRNFRIFTGYAGWGPGQLENELQIGGWLVKSANYMQIFGDADELWKQVTRAIGDEITRQAFNIRHVPADPQCN
ncbi:MAG: YqgE/AlgH family protein, partial [Planctomycetales bacterium]|nr:YqgE/AlgH family protein [Planctomycetales bacterium]